MYNPEIKITNPNDSAKMKVMKFFIGAIAVFIFMWATGQTTLLLVSIICTMGVGLFVWIPLSYLVGSLIVKLFYFIFGKKEVVLINNAQKTLTNNQRALCQYIQQARQNQMTDENINAILLQQGWKQEEITNASDMLKQI